MTPVLVVATRNPGKWREVSALFEGIGVELHNLDAYPSTPLVEERHDSYLANAAAKAVAIAEYVQLPALADDSGLEVDALAGRPGVRSARFAGDGASDAENLAQLLAELRDTKAPRRTARFRCVLVAARPDGTGLFAEGVCEGTITRTPRGHAGFGYDPLFYYAPLGRTFAELAAETKNGVSHRATACARMKPFLRDFLVR